MKVVVGGAPRGIEREIYLPGSKSVTNRALLLAALARGRSTVRQVLVSDDTVAFVGGLIGLGVAAELDEKTKTCVVEGCGGQLPQGPAQVEVRSAGTAARFLLAMAAGGRGRYAFDGSEQMRRRPMGPLIEALTQMGARFEDNADGRLPLTLLANGLRGGEYQVSGSEVSSQYLSALMMAAPLADGEVVLRFAPAISRPYLDLTAEMMRDFGVEMSLGERSARITPQAYVARDYEVEVDASTASYFFALPAILGGSLEVGNLSRNACAQGDIRFLDVLEMMGCQVESRGTSTRVSAPTEGLQGVEVSMTEIADTFMTLACLAPCARSPVTITGVGHTRHQESDRLAAVAQGLNAAGIGIETGPDWIRIFPGRPKAADIETHEDHRIAMSFTLLGLQTSGLVVTGAECVAKTCPDFYDLMAEAAAADLRVQA